MKPKSPDNHTSAVASKAEPKIKPIKASAKTEDVSLSDDELGKVVGGMSGWGANSIRVGMDAEVSRKKLSK